MRRLGIQGSVRAATVALLLSGCRTAQRPPALATAAESPDPGPMDPVPDAGSPQPGAVIADISGTAVLALSAPQFAQLPRDQRMLAFHVSQAGAAGEATALDQSWRHNLAIVRILRGILSRPSVAPPAMLPRVRAFARLLWLNGGLHDRQTGRKEIPSFTLSDLRGAALAAQAAGADLGLGPLSLEFALRALEGPLFDARMEAQRTVHGADLTASAVNLYDSVTRRDLRGLHEKYVLNSRLARDDTFIVEQVIRLPAAAAALEQALAYAAPPQRAVLEPLIAYLRSGEPEAFRAAQRAWLEAAGQVDFFAGFFDRSADPRGRKAIFGALVGLADPERTPLLEALALAAPRLEEKLPWPQKRLFPRPAAAEALLLVGAAGAARPLYSFGLTLPLEAAQRDAAGVKTAVFGAAEEAVARIRTDPALRTLAEPFVAARLGRCLPQLRFAFLALREIAGRPAGRAPTADTAELLQGGIGALDEARADVAAHFLSPDPLLIDLGLLTPACQALWPHFAATSWFASAAGVPQGDRIEDERQRALQLQIWWFTAKGALIERHDGARHFLSAPDPARFHAAAGELLSLLREIESLGDGARLNDLLERHASRIDPRWRDEVLERLAAVGIPRRVAALPPEIRPVFKDGKMVDVEAAPIDDLDAKILRDWQNL